MEDSPDLDLRNTAQLIRTTDDDHQRSNSVRSEGDSALKDTLLLVRLHFCEGTKHYKEFTRCAWRS